MTRRQHSRKRAVDTVFVRLVLGTLSIANVGWCGVASAQSRLSVDTAVSAGVTSNPYQDTGATPTVGSLTAEITPVYALDSTLTKVRIEGNARVSAYSSRYRVNDSYELRASGQHRLSEMATVNVDLGYLNSVAGSLNDLNGSFGIAQVLDPTIPTSIPVSAAPTQLDNPALSGVGRRRSNYRALGSIALALSPRDQIAVRAAGSATRYPDAVGLDEFNEVSGGLSYQRRLSEGLSGAINVDVGKIDYLGTGLSDSTIIQPGVSVTRDWSEGWSLTASLGVAVVRIEELIGGTRTSTNFNGALAFCRRDERWNACLTASRATLPSSVQGVRTQTSIAASFGYRLSATDDLSLSASYSRADAPLLNSLSPGTRSSAVDFVTAIGRYSKRIAPRLSGFAAAGISKSFDDFRRDPNTEGRIGVSYRLGDRP